jgi:tetratricopeptide (TPR) repeat protein
MLFVGMAWRIGWGYLLMYFFLILIGLAEISLGSLVIVHLPKGLHQMLAMAANCYYTIMGYHLMGYVLMQYHDRIGYEVELDEKEFAAGGAAPVDNEAMDLLNRVDVLIKEGNTDDAIYLIKNQAGELLSDPELSERYYNLLKVKGLAPEMLDHARAYLDILAKSNRKDKLCEVYLECASKSTEFVPSASSLFKVASALNERRRPKEALRLYNRFVKLDPHNALVPKAYFLGASIIHEKLKDPKKAAGILKGLIKKFPNHEIIPYATRSLKQIKGA